MAKYATVALTFSWTFWYKEVFAKNEDWKTNIEKLFEVSSATQFIEAYNKMKLPSALPIGASYYFFKKGIQPAWEEEPNKNAGAWKILISNEMANDLNLLWSDLLFTLISDGFRELSNYLCGITCNTRQGNHKITIWTVKTTRENHEYIMKIGKILLLVTRNVYKAKSIKYKLHDRSSNDFDYTL